MEADLSIQEGLMIPGYCLWFVASRASGPGGQHLNKTSSRVSLYCDLEKVPMEPWRRARVRHYLQGRINREGMIQINVGEGRSQYQNRLLARARLVKLFQEALRPRKPRVATRPSRSAKRRRLKQKRRRAEIKKMRAPPERE